MAANLRSISSLPARDPRGFSFFRAGTLPAALLLVAFAVTPALAAPTTWNGGVGAYTTGTEWDTLSAPTNADAAIINAGTASATTLSIRPDIASNGASLTVGGTGAINVTTNDVDIRNAGIVTQTGGTVSASRWVITGQGLGGDHYNISNGTVTAGDAVILGNAPGNSQFTQSGGTVNSNVWMGIGQSPGTSTYNLSNGAVNVGVGTDDLRIGFDPGATGIMNQSGGTVTSFRHILVGVSGTGEYNLTGTGVVNTTQGFIAGNGGGSTGTINQGPGTTVNAGWIGAGQSAGGGLDLYNQTGGTANAVYVRVGENAGSNGQYDLSVGTLNAGTTALGANGGIVIANAGGSTGVFNQTSGIVNAGNPGQTSWMGIAHGGTGTYNLSDGTLNARGVGLASNVASLSIAALNGSVGALNQTGGIVNSDSGLTMGRDAGSNATYDMDAGTLNILGGGGGPPGNVPLEVGRSGLATFDQSGGTVNVTGETWVSVNNTSSGSGYSLTGTGILNTDGIRIGGNGGSNGTFNQNGAATQLNSSQLLVLGQAAGSTGTYNLSAGTLNANGPGTSLWVGVDGTGIFNQTGGDVTVVGEAYVGSNGSSNGTYNMDGAASTLTVGSNFQVGRLGPGTFTQDGGTVTVNGGEFQLGNAAGVTGTYTINDGTVDLNVRTRIGNAGGSIGVFNQNGGTVDIAGHNVLAQNVGATGTYNLTSGTVNSNSGGGDAQGLWVGVSGDGEFNQSGGTHNVTREMYVGGGGTSTGVYNLDGGDLNVIGAGTGNIRLGQDGVGTINQTDGNLTTDGFIAIGQNATTGTYNISGGTANLNDPGTGLWVGVNGNATVNQTGGDVNVPAAMRMAGQPASTGTYNLSDGNLAVGGDVFGSGTSTMRVEGSLPTFTVGGNYTQNALSTLNSVLDNGGVTKIAVTGATTVAGTVDVDLLGGSAVVTSTSHLLIGGGAVPVDSSLLDAASDVLWNKSTVGNNVQIDLEAALDQGPVSYVGTAGPFPGINEGFATLNGLPPDGFAVVLDVDLTGASLSDLVMFMNDNGHTATLLGPGSSFDVGLAFDTGAPTSFFIWDFSDFDALNSSTTLVTSLGAVVPEPSTLGLAALGLVTFCGRRRRRRRA